MIKEGIKRQRQKAQSVGNDKTLSSKNFAPLGLWDSGTFRRGFTLIELLVVIVLMAIIIAVSAPAFVGMGRGTGMRGAVRSVHSTLSLLRQWAITHREQVTFVYFQGANGSESYYYATNEFGTAIISANNPTKLPMEARFAFNGGADNDSVTFKTDGGLASGATPVEVIIADRKGYSVDPDTALKKTISINGLTGGIRVE